MAFQWQCFFFLQKMKTKFWIGNSVTNARPLKCVPFLSFVPTLFRLESIYESLSVRMLIRSLQLSKRAKRGGLSLWPWIEGRIFSPAFACSPFLSLYHLSDSVTTYDSISRPLYMFFTFHFTSLGLHRSILIEILQSFRNEWSHARLNLGSSLCRP